METIYKLISDSANAYKNCDKEDHCSKKKYGELFGVNLRGYTPTKEHTLVSKNALVEWNSLTSKDINECFGANTSFRCDKLKHPIKKDLYKGNQFKKPYKKDVELNNASTLRFNELFIFEHLTTISDIKKAILDLDEITPESVKELLDSKVYVCRILKSENAKIAKEYNSKRGLDINWILENVYKDIPVHVSK